MTANHVTSPVEVADLVSRQKPGLADVIRRDKKVATPAMELQEVCDRNRARATIVKGEQQGFYVNLGRGAVEHSNVEAPWSFLNRLQVPFKFLALQFVYVGVLSREATAAKLSGRDDIMIEQSDDHRPLASRFQWRYLVNHG
jgi:hypothetical protein